jgi:NAD-dependent dihydropyrimidine dehydrogenase PreA subunit
MCLDVLEIVQTHGSFPDNCVQCGTCIDNCPKTVLRYRFSSEPFRRKGRAA